MRVTCDDCERSASFETCEAAESAGWELGDVVRCPECVRLEAETASW